jgi:flagellar biosynthesis GTPase FlhF
MKKGAVSIVALFLAAGVLFAQEDGGPDEAAPIDYAELEQNLSPVTFINYEGPYARIDSRTQIWSIGYELGAAIREGASFAGERNRYYVFHSVTAPEFDRLNADIFGLGPDAGVDHIRNLRLIIQGYLEAAYGYSAGDAALIAEFSTVYNAVFRGNWPYFSTRYKTALVEYLTPTPERAGLSIRFDEWPGQTMMTLPLLTATANSLSAVDTGAISGEEVIDEMRKDDDLGVEARQGLVDLKVRESEQAAQAAAEQRQQIEEEERRIAEQSRETAAAREEAAGEAARIEQERADLAASDASPEEKAAEEQRLREQEDALAETNRQLDEQEAALEEQTRALDEQREQATQNETLADQRTDEAQNERQAIAEDQAVLIAQGPPTVGNVPQTGTVAVRLTNPASALGVPVRIEPATGNELQQSSLRTVNANTLVTASNRVFAIAVANTANNGAVRLIEIDLGTLGMKTQGEADIIEGSPLWTSGANLYALVSVDGATELARFNLDLAQQAVTRTGIHPKATVMFAGNRLLIQGPDGGIISLDPNTLAR